jgi:hypothetical protein
MLIQLSASAQLLNLKIGSDALVEGAIKDAIVLVESKYFVQDVESKQAYGRNGKSYFNTVPFLGCKTDNGVITSAQVVTPWVVDKLYDKYRDQSKYQPLLENTLSVRSLSTDSIQTIDISSKLSFNTDSTLVCTDVACNPSDGLMLCSDENDIINWVIWIRQSTTNESPQFGYSIVKKTVEFTNDKGFIDPPASTNSLIGGLYISAKVVSVGLVEFSLSGLVIENSGRWIVEQINVNSFSSITNNVSSNITSQVSDASEDILTPIKENSKGNNKRTKANKKK